jgi:cytochrome c556
MRITVIAYVVSTGCGGMPAQPATPTPAAKPLHSPELDRIMKNEVNQPYSALVFGVFHSENGVDYAAIATPLEVLRSGIAKVRNIADPPVETSEARAVFFTYLESLAHDTEKLRSAVARRDPSDTEAALVRLGKTCNSCHHFFRLEIQDTPEK